MKKPYTTSFAANRSPFQRIAMLLFSFAATALSQHRPPAVPLVTHDPYFSIWSTADTLTAENTRHWTGAQQPLAGLIRIDGKPYRFMGADPREVPAMRQLSVQVNATSTVYAFEAAGLRLNLTFFTPAFPQDLALLSRPVTYLTWTASATDNASHQIAICLDIDPRIAVNTPDQPVTWSRSQANGLTVLNVGSQEQKPVNRSGDNLRIDWGYFHLAVPENEPSSTVAAWGSAESFAKTGEVPKADDMDMPRSPSSAAAHLAVVLPVNIPAGQSVSRHVLVSYTEGFAIEYLQRRLKPYWQRNGESTADMLTQAEEQYPALQKRGAEYDTELAADLATAGGKPYADLAILAYRQTLAAHKLVADVDGTPLMFSKENFSNGCIGTVDVLYPAAPFFLLLSPQLLEAQMKPLLDYAELPRWKWPFAPHDLGQYPLANGQVYGGGERTEEDQMPIEESGNLLILAGALARAQGDTHVARQYWPLLTKWAEYLLKNGLDPENQLSTDDFAGHLAHNANLSIKAVEALGAYAEMARALGHTDEANRYSAAAKQMAEKWRTMALDGDHYKLAFDTPGSWSQKYNLVWDKLLSLNLFPAEVHNTELDFYLKHLNQYGLPLDSRADYTKLDWEIWTATLADNSTQFDALLAPITKWVGETPNRVPLTDWYDTQNGKQIGFQARSVVGGIYIKALSNPEIAKKWQRRTTP
jgi:hypothetical protein